MSSTSVAVPQTRRDNPTAMERPDAGATTGPQTMMDPAVEKAANFLFKPPTPVLSPDLTGPDGAPAPANQPGTSTASKEAPDPFPSDDKEHPSTVDDKRSLPDNSVLTVWSSGSSERKFADGVTVSHTDDSGKSKLKGDANGNGTTVVRLTDKTTIETDDSAAEIGAGGNAGSSTSALKANGALVTLPDGTRVRATANGIQFIRPGSTTVETVAKGKSLPLGDTILAVKADGSSTITMKGAVVTTDADGVSTTAVGGADGPQVAGDGSVTTGGVNHASETRDAMGNPIESATETVNTDGVTSTVSENGNTRMMLPDKTVMQTKPDGNRVTATLSDGIVIETTDVADPNASTDQGDGNPYMDKKKDPPKGHAPTRSTTVTLADGSRVTFKQNSVTMRDSSGKTSTVMAGTSKKDIFGPGTPSIAMNGAGIATMTLPGGRKIVVGVTEDPTTTLPGSAAGENTTLFGDGGVTVTKANNTNVYDPEGKVVATAVATTKNVDVSGPGKVTTTQKFSNGLMTNTLSEPDGDTVISRNADEGQAAVRTKAGAEIVMGSDHLSALLPNGSTLMTTEDGVQVETASGTDIPIKRGAPPVKLSDGTTVEMTAIGELNVVMPDHVGADGKIDKTTTIHADFDGKITTTLADGRIVNSDGTVTIKTPLNMAADGSYSNAKPSELSRTMDLDGTVIDYSTLTTRDGFNVEIFNSGREIQHIGSVSIDLDKDAGTIVTQLPSATIRNTSDGSSFSCTLPDKSTIYFDGQDWYSITKTGTKKKIEAKEKEVKAGGFGSSGAGYDLKEDGTFTITLADKTTIILDKNHQVKINSAAGASGNKKYEIKGSAFKWD